MTACAQPPPSDASLAARVAHGDVAAFEALYERDVREVYALAAHVLGKAAAEETVQDVFLRLWERAGQFQPSRGSFGGWFMSLARNRILDTLRRRRMHEIPVAEIEDLIPASRDDIEGDLWRKERGARILNALRALPPEQRRALILSYFGGLSQTAIATTAPRMTLSAGMFPEPKALSGLWSGRKVAVFGYRSARCQSARSEAAMCSGSLRCGGSK